MDNGRHRKPWSFVSEATFLASLSCIVYLAAYKFESGYCEYWGLPEELIQISVERLATLGLLTVSLFLTWLVPVITLGRPFLARVSQRPSLQMAILPALATLAASLILLVDPEQRPLWWLYLIGILFISALQYGLPLIVSRVRKTSFWEAEDQTRLADRLVVTPYDWIVEKFGEQGWPLLLILLVSLFVSPLAGTYSARSQRAFAAVSYMAPPNGNTCEALIVVRRYADQLFCVRADTCSKVFRNHVIPLNLGDLSRANATIEQIYIRPLSSND